MKLLTPDEIRWSLSEISSNDFATLYPRVIIGGLAIIYFVIYDDEHARKESFASPWEVGKLILLTHLFGIFILMLGFAANGLWGVVADWTFQATASVLKIFTSDVISDVSQFKIGTSRFSGTLTEACSGLEGVGLISAFLGLYLYRTRSQLNWPRPLILFPLAWGLSWFINLIRIVGLILIGDKISPEIATEGFHSQSGWLAFTMIALFFTMSIRYSSFFSKQPSKAKFASEIFKNQNFPYLLPMIVLLAIGLGTELFSNGFNWFHPIQYIFAALALAVVLPSTESFKVGSIPFALIAGVLVAVLWVYITPANAQQNLLISSKLLSLGVLGDFWLGAKLLGYVIIVPISEELAFRGFFVRWIKSRDFRSVELRSTSTFALIASSFIFGMFHQNLMLGAIAGVCFGWVAKRGNSVWDAVFAHVVANGLIAAYAYHAGMWVILS